MHKNSVAMFVTGVVQEITVKILKHDQKAENALETAAELSVKTEAEEASETVDFVFDTDAGNEKPEKSGKKLLPEGEKKIKTEKPGKAVKEKEKEKPEKAEKDKKSGKQEKGEKEKKTEKPEKVKKTVTDEERREKSRRRAKWRNFNRFMDRVAGFIIVTVIIVGFSALAFEYLCVKGPSPSFRDTWLNTFSETRRFDFINNLFFTQKELDEMRLNYGVSSEVMTPTFDSSLVTISEEKTDVNGMDAYGLIDDDGDGVIFQKVSFRGSTAYMIIVLDPHRVFMGCAQDVDAQWGSGIVLDDMVAKYGARGGINAGIFRDDNGAGTGWPPTGITISQGVVYEDYENGLVAGIDRDGILYCGSYNIDQCIEFGIQNACSFGPILIANGVKSSEETLSSGVNPRTAIGQRGDGAIVMLVVDGRQAYSFGLSYGDCADLLLSYGVINAMNMDGGSSTSMYMDGQLINHPSNQAGGTRYLPTAWLFK